MTKCQFGSVRSMHMAIDLAVISVPAPAETGTIIVISRSGYASAWAVEPTATEAITACAIMYLTGLFLTQQATPFSKRVRCDYILMPQALIVSIHLAFSAAK